MSNGYYTLNNITTYSDLPYQNKYAFVTLSCQCEMRGGSSNCCQGPRANLNVQGINSDDPDSMDLQLQYYIADICALTMETIGDENVLPPTGEEGIFDEEEDTVDPSPSSSTSGNNLFADDYTVARQPSSVSPSKKPTFKPVTNSPTTKEPTSKPITNSPTFQPTGSLSPSNAPTLSGSPTDTPTHTSLPTSSPTITMKPSASPSESPSVVLITGIVDNPGRGGFDTRNDDETNSGGLSSWAITGIVLASLAVLVLIMYVLMPTKKNDEDDEEDVGCGENDEDLEQTSNEEAITTI